MKINATKFGKKLQNLRSQMNSELREIKIKNSGAGIDDAVV